MADASYLNFQINQGENCWESTETYIIGIDNNSQADAKQFSFQSFHSKVVRCKESTSNNEILISLCTQFTQQMYSSSLQ